MLAHRTDDKPCACDDCMDVACEDNGTTLDRLTPEQRADLRAQMGDDRVGLRIVIEGHRGTVIVEPIPEGREVTAEDAAFAAGILLGYRPGGSFRLAQKSSGIVLQPDEPPHSGTWVLVEVGDVV